MAENPTTTQEQEAPERTFTQAEMNAIIADRLSRERAKYADYDALKEKADQFDAAQEAGKTELQKANERAAALQTQVDALTRANEVREVRGKVSAATGVPAELLRRHVKLRLRQSSSLPRATAIPRSRTGETPTRPRPVRPATSLPRGLTRSQSKGENKYGIH